MKNKVVVWGTNAAEEKVLIALELKAEANKVILYTFPEAVADDEFVNKMMNEWRENKSVDFPQEHTTIERELSVADSLLPDDLKVEKSVIIQRAQTEWHFTVLSTKLNQAYQQELAEFKEKVGALAAYDGKMWDSLKGFWDKVQGQSRERNLFKEHADGLRDNINLLFNDLKKLRETVKSEFATASLKVADEFNNALTDIEERIAAGGSKLNSVLEDLKQMQRRYRDAKLSNEHRSQIWDRLDAAFKNAKERKFGPGTNDGTLSERHEKRLTGLIEAIKRVEDTIRRDEEDLHFQHKKVSTTEGQLEAQIRMAKIKMIEERLGSRREKLTELLSARTDIERQMASAKNKEAKIAEKEANKVRLDAAKEQVKLEMTESARKSAESPKEDSLFEAASTVLGDVLMDALDTAKAVASVVAEKAEDALEKALDKAEEVVEAMTQKEETATEETVTSETTAEAPTPKKEKAPKKTAKSVDETPTDSDNTAA